MKKEIEEKILVNASNLAFEAMGRQSYRAKIGEDWLHVATDEVTLGPWRWGWGLDGEFHEALLALAEKQVFDRIVEDLEGGDLELPERFLEIEDAVSHGALETMDPEGKVADDMSYLFSLIRSLYGARRTVPKPDGPDPEDMALEKGSITEDTVAFWNSFDPVVKVLEKYFDQNETKR